MPQYLDALICHKINDLGIRVVWESWVWESWVWIGVGVQRCGVERCVGVIGVESQ